MEWAKNNNLTLEEMYGLPLLAGNQNAIAITDVWK
jgi:hypothetical protein